PDDWIGLSDVASITGRDGQMVRRIIRALAIPTMADPADGRAKMIPWDAVLRVWRYPSRAEAVRTVRVHRVSDGTELTLTVRQPRR
ncbi:MAG TPA: hypothetical protein VGK16_03680, partial [Candidatus Limnocylindrales bacterium]